MMGSKCDTALKIAHLLRSQESWAPAKAKPVPRGGLATATQQLFCCRGWAPIYALAGPFARARDVSRPAEISEIRARRGVPFVRSVSAASPRGADANPVAVPPST